MSGGLLVFGGTTEARELLASGLTAVCSVATEYGASLLAGLGGVRTVVGRMDAAAISTFIRNEHFSCVIDATHPYAAEATVNIKKACEENCVPLLRLCRESTQPPAGVSVRTVASCGEAAALLDESGNAALLTVGSKELDKFTRVREYQKRLYVRVLPLPEVVSRCAELGFGAGRVIAMQGPFSAEMNEAMIKMTKAAVIVTKDGGPAGGAMEKYEAARRTGVSVIL